MKSLRNVSFYVGVLCAFHTSTFAEMGVVLLNCEINISFKEQAPGVFFPADSRIDATELALLLKDPKVSFVVLDNRYEYTFGGDKKIQTNKDFIQNWYKQAKIAIGEHNIHKLVWLPKQKVVDDLMSRMSFIPEAWLLKMDHYYALYGSGGSE